MTSLSRAERPDLVPGQKRPPEYRYHLLRAALTAGRPGLANVDAVEMMALAQQADKSFELESLVLGAVEAADVVIPSERLDQAVAEIGSRYTDRDAFLSDLAANGLDEDILHSALQRELRFDATLQRVAARSPAVGDVDERLFYELHKERFNEPERRTARHLLITVNDEFPENRYQSARVRIEALADRLAGRTNRFPGLARRHSECPTAMEDGRLGIVPRGQLYPALDSVLFALDEGAVGGPVESEVGLHLLWCEKIHLARTLPFSKARPRIRQVLEERARRHCQKAWISDLRRGLR